MNKQELIDQFLSEPVKVGDNVVVRGLGRQDSESFGNSTDVKKVHKDGSISIQQYNYSDLTKVKPEDYRKTTFHIGANPFPEKPWNSNLRIVAYSLDSIVGVCGYDRRKRVYKFETIKEHEVPELNWNPFILDKDGNEVVYQRDFCWNLEQKQLLIESIYRNIDIGKIVVRKRSYEWVKKRVLAGKTAAFKDIVDGKQRLNAILGFLNNEFADLQGNTWNDLSENAHHKFLDFMSVAYGEIGEEASDEDVKAIFLNVNFAGVQMSKEHIEFVKSINL
ncbi:MAG: DUF262 domain-containing protein [Nanoarchaeota archaeon]